MYSIKYTCTSVYVHICNKDCCKGTHLHRENTRYHVHMCTCVHVRVGVCGHPKGLAKSGREEGKVIECCFRERVGKTISRERKYCRKRGWDFGSLIGVGW